MALDILRKNKAKNWIINGKNTTFVHEYVEQPYTSPE
jgi:hypothetical protein